MGERKILNKYYPPDFDPSRVPRIRQPKNQQTKSRFMLNMSIRCKTCGNFIGRGTKCNARKETIIGETYLGIQKFRFYLKCTNCAAEITVITDPQNSDYEVETNATRNFEPWRDGDAEEEERRRRREIEETGDAMKSLENRIRVSKRDMDNFAALDELKSVKSRQSGVTVESMLEALRREDSEKGRKLEEEEALVIKSAFQRQKAVAVRRISDDLFNDEEEKALNGGLKKRKLLEVCSQSVSVIRNDFNHAFRPAVRVSVTKKSKQKEEKIG